MNCSRRKEVAVGFVDAVRYLFAKKSRYQEYVSVRIITYPTAKITIPVHWSVRTRDNVCGAALVKLDSS
nr:hypothetical protein CFP56_65188 [Quercus suber]